MRDENDSAPFHHNKDGILVESNFPYLLTINNGIINVDLFHTEMLKCFNKGMVGSEPYNQVATAIIIKLALIPGDITPSSSPIAEAAMIRLKREESKKPADSAFLLPNCFLKRKAGINLMANNNRSRIIRKGISVSSNSFRADHFHSFN